MMVMTAKVDLKKLLAAIAAAAAVILGAILLLGGGNGAPTAATGGQQVSGNDARVQFLRDKGWEVTTSPAETSRVRIPEASGEVFDRYNLLQKSQGYDLTEYAGENVMRYVYKVHNFPGATEPVYATLLVHKDQVIGGDITDTAAKGQIRGFQMPAGTEHTVPSEAATMP